jgi:hypothetical protein
LERARIGADGCRAFNALCRILVCADARSEDSCSPCCMRVRKGEAAMLTVLSSLQRDDYAAAHTNLRHHYSPTASRLAIAPAELLASSLYARGLYLHQQAVMASRRRVACVTGPAVSTAIH